MSTVVVLDASAAVRAVMDSQAQPSLLDRLSAAPLVLAPGLMRIESANALWRYGRAGVIDRSQVLIRHAEVLTLVHRFIEEPMFFPEVLDLASEFDHPVYDAVYAITARRNAATLLSFDRRLHGLCVRAGIACELFGA